MGRRSRKRTPVSAGPRPAASVAPVSRPAPAAVRRRARSEDRPAAPWGSAPLTEVATLLGLAALLGGFVARSTPVLAAGFVLVALAAVELAVREHLAGFRSHTTLLAGAAAMVVGTPLVALGAPRSVQVAGVVGALAAAWIVLRRAFVARTGGLGFRA
jgi:hypothetical protein